jgi:hypothetical protein
LNIEKLIKKNTGVSIQYSEALARFARPVDDNDGGKANSHLLNADYRLLNSQAADYWKG